MEDNFNNRIIQPCFYSCDSIITEVNKEFIDFTSFTLNELLDKSLVEIGDMLKLNSQIIFDNISGEYSGYIFTKLLEAKEVNISLVHNTVTNKKKFTFIEKPNSRLDDKIIFIEHAFIDEISGVAIYSVPNLILLKANQKYLDTMNPPFNKEENTIGRPITEIVTGFIGSKAQVIWENILETKKSSHVKAFKLDTAKRGVIYLDSTKTPIFENGKMKYIFTTAIDTTEKVEQSKEIEDQKKALKSQGDFFANISHELKTPLNVISAAAQLFNMYCKSGSLDEKKDPIIKYIDSIMQNTFRLSKLINNIVDLSKIEAGFFKLNLSNNNIIEVVEEIVTSVTSLSDSKGLNIIFDTNSEEKIIACDPEKIERIVLNLISNAIKFSDIGDEIFVQVKDRNEFVEISVKDNGIGIEDKDLYMIFERFKQVDKSLSRNSEGSGIGLSLVKSIVELHGGSIRVESKLRKGSKFIVRLPSDKVSNENRLYTSNIKNSDESIQIELSDVYM